MAQWIKLFVNYCGELIFQWLSTMSARLSGATLLAAIIFTAIYNKSVSTTKWLVVIAFFISSFLVWKRERVEKEEKQKEIKNLKEKFELRFSLHFDPANSNNITDVSDQIMKRARAFRLEIRSQCNQRVLNCQGRLISITPPVGNSTRHQYIILTITSDATSKDLDTTGFLLLDVLNVLSPYQAKALNKNIIEIPSPESLPNGTDWKKLFSDKGNYILNIQVVAEQVQPVSCALKFAWTGDWETATMEMVG